MFEGYNRLFSSKYDNWSENTGMTVETPFRIRGKVCRALDILLGLGLLGVGITYVLVPHIYQALHLTASASSFMAGPGKWIILGAGAAYTLSILPKNIHGAINVCESLKRRISKLKTNF